MIEKAERKILVSGRQYDWFHNHHHNCHCIRPNVPFGIEGVKDKKLKVPLKDIRFKVDIKDCLSTVEITQLYTNTNKTSVECEYVFPIDPQTTALTSLVVTMDNKTIEAKVTEKDKADEKYADAIARGDTAFKMNQDEQQPDIIRLAIGNLLPEKNATIVVRYVKLLEAEDGNWCFRIPLAYTPKYGKPAATDKKGAGPEFVKGKNLPYKWHLNMTVRTSKPITRMASPSHKIDVEFKDSSKQAIINLADRNEVPDSDLIVSFKTEEFSTPSAILQKSPEFDGYAALISFYPSLGEEKATEEEVDEDDGSGEYFFVLDCSGSMRGGRIELAKSALEMFLRSLPVDSKFNIVCFGNSFKFFRPGTVKYTPESLKDALDYLTTIKANMGGTEISKALGVIYAVATDPFYPRSIFLLTDGAVAQPEEVVNMIKKNAYNTRVHCFGIGSGASRALVKGSALAGKGSFQFAIEGEDLTPKIVSSLKKATLGACTNAKIIWPPGVTVQLQSTLSDQVSNVYMNEPFTALAILKGPVQGGKVALEFKETINHKNIHLEVTLPDEAIDGIDVYQAAVKDAFEKNTGLMSKEIIDLSIKYSVLSAETAFIAVQKNLGKSGKAMEVVKIPIAITKDAEPVPQFAMRRSGFRGLALNSAIPNQFSGGRGRGGLEKIRKKCAPRCAPGSMAKSKAMPIAASSSAMKMELVEFDEEEKSASPVAAPIETGYSKVVVKQEMFGNWVWNAETFSAIGVPEADARSNIPEGLTKTISDEKTLLTVWVTILALARLEHTYANSRESWQLVYKKSVQWLKKSGVNYAEYKSIANMIIS